MSHTVTITLELTDEDIQGARHRFFGGWAQAPQLAPQDVVDKLLLPTMRADLHRWSSHKKWIDGTFRKHLPKGATRQVRSPIEGSWECAKSLTKVCWYDDHQDTAWDNCLFCGEPHERK